MPATPLEILQNLSSLTVGDKAIEVETQEVGNWRGFTFELGRSLSVVFPFMGGFEILPERDFQSIPWTAEWVKGLVNIRGEVYTVIDFAQYIGLPGVRYPRTATLFMLPCGKLKSVLLIQSRVNLKTFSESAERLDDHSVPERLRPYLSMVLQGEEANTCWAVLDVDRLSQSQGFINISYVQ